MIASIDEWSPALELVDEETEEVRLLRVVETLNASLRDDTAIVCAHDEKVRGSSMTLARSPSRTGSVMLLCLHHLLLLDRALLRRQCRPEPASAEKRAGELER